MTSATAVRASSIPMRVVRYHDDTELLLYQDERGETFYSVADVLRLNGHDDGCGGFSSSSSSSDAAGRLVPDDALHHFRDVRWFEPEPFVDAGGLGLLADRLWVGERFRHFARLCRRLSDRHRFGRVVPPLRVPDDREDVERRCGSFAFLDLRFAAWISPDGTAYYDARDVFERFPSRQTSADAAGGRRGGVVRLEAYGLGGTPFLTGAMFREHLRTCLAESGRPSLADELAEVVRRFEDRPRSESENAYAWQAAGDEYRAEIGSDDGCRPG